MAQGFTWNIDRAQAAYLYRMVHNHARDFHPMYNPVAEKILTELHLFLACHPWKDANGWPLPADSSPLLPYPEAQARVGQPGGD